MSSLRVGNVMMRPGQGALVDLSEVESALRDSLSALEDHADTIWESQQRSKAHELTIGEEARASENKTDKDWLAIHREHSSQHERVANAHKRIKKHHQEVVTEATRLLKKVRSAM